MRVINIDEEYIFGGPERRIVNVASELNKIGVETIIFLPISTDKTFLNFVVSNNVKFIELPLSPLSLQPKRLINYILKFIFEVYIIVKNIKRINPDLIHVNGAYQFKSAIAGKIAGSKVVWHINNTHANPLVFLVFQIISLFCADGYIAASKLAKNYFLNYRWQKSRDVFIIQAPIRISDYSNTFKADKQNLSIGTISGFNRQKNPLLYAKTAHLIAEKYPNVKFSIAAHLPRNYNKYLESFDKEVYNSDLKIEKLGFVKDIPKYLSSLDLFLYVSSWEGSPTALWEAMASSLAIVTTNVGSASEFVGEKYNSGILVEDNNPQKLYLAVRKIIENPNVRKNYGFNAYKIATESLNLNKIAVLHKNAYKLLIL